MSDAIVEAALQNWADAPGLDFETEINQNLGEIRDACSRSIADAVQGAFRAGFAAGQEAERKNPGRDLGTVEACNAS